MLRLLPSRVSAVLVLAGVALLPLHAQPTERELRLRQTGRTLYTDHCAGCHGVSARGDGPAAASMRRTPSDLTGYAKANGGVFPTEQLRTIIDGRGVGAHGSVEMPVWGAVFKRTGGNEAAVQERIDAILAYLRGLQARTGH